MKMEDIISSECYPRTLLDGLALLYKKKSMVDCELFFKDGEFVKAHQCVLAAASGYLQTEIDNGAMSSGTFLIKSISSSDFLVLLEFMYTGQLKLSQSTVWGISNAAAILDIPDAVKLCKDFIDLKGGLIADSADCRSDEDSIAEVKKLPKRRTSSGNTRTRKHNKSLMTLNNVRDSVSMKKEIKEENQSHSKKKRKKKNGTIQKGKEKTKFLAAKKSAESKSNVPYPKFKCKFCPQKMFYYSCLQMHLRIHQVTPVYLRTLKSTKKYKKLTVKTWISSNGREAYQCTCCSEIFHKSIEARKHVAKRHNFVFSLACAKCPKPFQNSKDLFLHKFFKHRNTLKDLKHCCLCARSFLYHGNLQSHFRIHEVEGDMQSIRRAKYYCRHCQIMVVNKLLYISHLTLHGLTEREVQLEFQEPSKVRIRSKIKETHVGGKRKPKAILTCEKCDRHYTSIHHLNAHMKLKHNCSLLAELPKRKKSIHCEEEDCGVICKDMDELRSHMDDSHPHIIYECSLCRYKGKVKHMFERHISRVHQKQNDKICEFCGKSFLKSYHLRVHRMRHHGVEDPSLKVFKCDEPGCKYQTFAMNILETHKQRHDKDKPFSCPLCAKKLKSQKNLEKHMKKIHERIRPFICEICGVDYGEESELKLHMNRHDDAKHFACEVCDYSTYSKSILESHMYVKHKVKTGRYKDMLKCDLCEFETPNPGKMEEHSNAHNNIRPHQCDKCDKAFFTKPTLKEHKKWVHDKVVLKCPYCVFTAPVKSHLKKHIRVLHTHRDLKPYKCFYCDYRCNVSGNCRKHIVQKHKGFEIKWIKLCDPPIPSLLPEPEDVSKTITNSGDTYIPKKGRKQNLNAQDKSNYKSNSNINKHEINFKTESLGTNYGQGGNTLSHTLQNNAYFRGIPGVIDNHQIDAASTLAKLSKLETIQNISQSGSGSCSIWQNCNLNNQHVLMTTSQADETFPLDNRSQLMSTYTENCTSGNINPTCIESINYMLSMTTQEGQGLSRSRTVLPNFQSMIPSESLHRNLLQHQGESGTLLARNSVSMPDVPSDPSIHIKDNE